MAVYINNTERSFNTLKMSLNGIRKIYPDECIVAVDNGSLNNKWHTIAKQLDMVVLENKSTIHRYEIGAYKCALQHFRADRYICIQGTLFLKKKVDLLGLQNQNPDAIAFKIVNALQCSNEGLELINKLLNVIDMGPWNNEPYFVAWNCFCCNNYFIEEMFKDGIFDLPSFTKNHSVAFERILGYYFGTKLKTVGEVRDGPYWKVGLQQDPFTI